VPDELRSVPDPVLCLEALFGPTLAEGFGMRLVEPPEGWLPRLPEEYRRRSIRLASMGEARSLEQPAFIKPPHAKQFPACVYRGSELPPDISDDSPVWISEIVEWEKEFRCFVLDRQLRTFSVYLRKGELQREKDFAHSTQEAQEVTGFIQKILADKLVDLPRATVLDVGVIKGRGWAMVEQNAAWGSGLYGCDPVEVLECLRYAAVKEH
jgi:hypothetical protein